MALRWQVSGERSQIHGLHRAGRGAAGWQHPPYMSWAPCASTSSAFAMSSPTHLKPRPPADLHRWPLPSVPSIDPAWPCFEQVGRKEPSSFRSLWQKKHLPTIVSVHALAPALKEVKLMTFVDFFSVLPFTAIACSPNVIPSIFSLHEKGREGSEGKS